MIGNELIVALSRTRVATITVHDGLAIFELTPADAIRFVGNQPDLRGFGRKRKVTRIERIKLHRPVAPWQSCWRTDGGSCAVMVHTTEPSKQNYLSAA